jgi:hypothetical protein
MNGGLGKIARINPTNNTIMSSEVAKKVRINSTNNIATTNKSFAQKMQGYPEYKRKLKTLAIQLSITITDNATKVHKKTLHQTHKALVKLKENRNDLYDILKVINETQAEHKLFVHNLRHQSGIKPLPITNNTSNNISNNISKFATFLKEQVVINEQILEKLKKMNTECLTNINDAGNLKERIIKENYTYAAELIASAHKNAQIIMNSKRHKEIVDQYKRENPHLSMSQQPQQLQQVVPQLVVPQQQVQYVPPVPPVPPYRVGGKKSPKKTTKKKSTNTRKKKTSTAKKSPKIHIGKRGGRYIIRKGRKIYQ